MRWVLIFLLILATPSVAQTPSEQSACKASALQFCRQSLKDGPFTVLACLNAHFASLSPRCKTVLREHGYNG